jgi:hypothetical protein
MATALTESFWVWWWHPEQWKSCRQTEATLPCDRSKDSVEIFPQGCKKIIDKNMSPVRVTKQANY